MTTGKAVRHYYSKHPQSILKSGFIFKTLRIDFS